MKKPLFSTLQLALLLLSVLSVRAGQVVYRSDVHYFSTNYAAGNGPTALYLANIRGQKTWRDLVVANKNDNTVTVRLCKDNGTFNTSGASYAVGLQPVAVIGVDLNNDLRDDVVAANFGTNTISVLVNQKNNTLSTATNYTVGLTATPGPVALAVGQATPSGLLDVFVANQNENSISVLINEGHAQLLLATNIDIGTGPASLVFGDVNGDTFGDVVSANTNGTLTVLVNDSVGGFSISTNITLFPGGDPQPVAIGTADFNRDGLVDVVTANYASNNITILTNSGSGFAIAASYDVGTNPRGLLVRDINRDGIVDIVTANENSANISIYLGVGDGTFVAGPTIATGTNPVAVAGSNFNADGMNDLAVAAYGDNAINILLYDLPLVFNDSVNAYEDVPKSLTLFAQQLTNAPLSYTILTSPSHGSLTGTGPTVLYTPDTNYFGNDSFTFMVNDGVNDSAVATNSVLILPVNDAPSFTLATNSIRATKFGFEYYSNFIASASAGPANELQGLTFLITSLTSPSIYSSKPTIQANRTLVFKASTNFGTSVVSVVVRDSGNTSYGGTNRSSVQTFTIENPGPNPFITVKGIYNGLFADAGGLSPDTSGAFTFTLSDSGTYSGSITLRGRRFGMSGQFDRTGAAQSRVTVGLVVYTVTLQLDLDNGSDRVTGTVVSTTESATLVGDRLTFDLAHPAVQAGQYTIRMPGMTNASPFPSGDSFGLITISTAGKVTFAGTLSDGAAVGQTSYISKNGDIPFYASIYGGNGVLTGWLTITNDPSTSVAGTLGWATGDYYLPGWSTNIAVSGSTYVRPASGQRFLDATNVVITVYDGGLAAPLTQSAVLKTNNTFTITNNTQRFGLTFNSSTATLGGTFVHPVTGLSVQFKAGIFQQQKTAEGYFKAGTDVGHFEITAP